MNQNPNLQVSQAEIVAKRFAAEIGKVANNKWRNGAQMTGVVVSILLQNVAFSLASLMFPKGHENGLKFIKTFYDGCKQDTLDKWNQFIPPGDKDAKTDSGTNRPLSSVPDPTRSDT